MIVNNEPTKFHLGERVYFSDYEEKVSKETCDKCKGMGNLVVRYINDESFDENINVKCPFCEDGYSTFEIKFVPKAKLIQIDGVRVEQFHDENRQNIIFEELYYIKMEKRDFLYWVNSKKLSKTKEEALEKAKILIDEEKETRQKIEKYKTFCGMKK